jgi:GTP cyclohydrolase II
MKIAKSGVSIRNKVCIPLSVGSSFFYTFNNLSDQKEHLTIALGDWEGQKVVNVRVHSECMTGEVFGSLKCECQKQLLESMEIFSRIGGLIIYLRQEGRGIGLYNKIDAYSLQDEGLDTVSANLKLNFEIDLRKYDMAAEMLKALNVSKIYLYSNNPSKVKGLSECGIEVIKRIDTIVNLQEKNYHYLLTKIEKCGHTIDLKKLREWKNEKNKRA